MKELRYDINNEGYITACGYIDSLPYIIDETTPFKSIHDSALWRYKNGEWEMYDPTWVDENYKVRISIPSDVVLMNDIYLQLKGWVLYLETIQRALYIMQDGFVIMYFVELLPEHEAILKHDTNVLIEYKQ